MNNPDDRKLLAERALANIEWFVNNNQADRMVSGKALLDKHEFIDLLNKNFDRLDEDRSNSISRAEIAVALSEIKDFSANEYVMLQLLARYFDFICELVDDNDESEKMISRADVDVLGHFLLGSNMTLEALYSWCSDPKGPPKGDLIKPPPLTGDTGG
jgi:hypothetical protein